MKPEHRPNDHPIRFPRTTKPPLLAAWRRLAGLVIVAAAAGCHAQPRPSTVAELLGRRLPAARAESSVSVRTDRAADSAAVVDGRRHAPAADSASAAIGHAAASPAPAGRRLSRLEEAQALYEAGRFRAAKTMLAGLRHIGPDEMAVFELQAAMARDEGDLKRMRHALRQATFARPESPLLAHWAGSQLLHLGDTDAGLPTLEASLRLAPHRSDYARDLAAAYVYAGNSDRAESVLHEARNAFPNDATIPLALARLSEATGDWESAAEWYAVAIRNEPHEPRWRRLRGRACFRAGRFAEAAEELKAAISMAGEQAFWEDYVEHAVAALRIDDRKSALASLDTLSRLTAGRLREVELLRSLCAFNAGDPWTAIGILEVAHVRWPEEDRIGDVLQLCRTCCFSPE